MVDALVRGLLGQVGSAILDYYTANSLWINTVILVYVFLIFLGKRSYASMKNTVQQYLTQEHGPELGNNSISWFKKTLKKHPMDWEEVKHSSAIPIVTPPKSWVFRAKTDKVIKELFSPELIASFYKKQTENPAEVLSEPKNT